jgi:Flp pilus assembly protein TadG
MAYRVLIRTLWRDSEGSALVEGSIILPVLFVLVFGVFEFSWTICQQHLILTGISDAARYIARSTTPHDPTTKKDAKYLATTGAVDGETPRVRGWTADDIDIAYTFLKNSASDKGLTNFRGGELIESVTVSTTFTVPPLEFFGILKLSPPTLNVSHQERILGPG